MLRYIINRTLRSLLTLFIVVSLVFILLRQMPVEGYFNNFDKLTETQIRVGLENLGLNSPVHIQLLRFYGNALKGDLGVSNKYRVGYPISELIKQKMPLSVTIGMMSVTLALAAGLPMGVLMAKSAANKKSRLKIFERFGSAFISLIQGIPQSVYHLFIQIYGTELLNKFFRLPLLFRQSNPLTWILPVFSLSLANMALYAMWIRRYIVDESSKDYVLLAKAKGVPPAAISRKHLFRNAVVPLVQYIPTTIMLTLMGSLYVESRYSIPGMGGLLVDSIKRQDNSLVQALVLIYTAASVLGVLIGDIAIAFADPRIRLSKKEGR